MYTYALGLSFERRMFAGGIKARGLCEFFRTTVKGVKSEILFYLFIF